MVKIVVVSEYSSNPPSTNGRVKIAGGPCYALDRVQALAADEDRLKLWTEKCRRDVHKLFDGDLEQVAALVGCLKASDYIDSEWCDNGNSALAACDAYSLRRKEFVPSAGKEMPIDYFLKFAVGKAGHLVLMVSCHL